MQHIPVRTHWGTTIKLAIFRSWCTGFTWVLLADILSGGNTPERFYIGFLIIFFGSPLAMPFIALTLFLMLIIPLTLARNCSRYLTILCFCLGDPIMYLLQKLTGVFRDVELKFFNSAAILFVEIEDF